jgi:hypothetical protein
MKKQTAVEWLENEFKEAHKMFGGIDTNWIKRFEQAKAMEMNQLEKFYNHGMWAVIEHGHGDEFIDYFDKTFKSE